MPRASLKMVIDNSAGQGLEKFCRYLLLHHGLKHNTIDNYRKIVRRFLEAGDDAMPDAKAVEDYIAGMYLADKYSYYHLTNTIRALEKYMAFLGESVKLARPRKPKFIGKDALSEAEIAVMLSVSGSLREKAIIGLLAYSGIRNEELCSVRVRDVDFSDNTVFVNQGKGSKDRVVPVTGDCMKLVMKYLAGYPRGENDFLFTTLRHGEQYTGWALRRLVKKIADKAGLEKKISPHTFRRSLASNMSARGADVQTIQHILGHANIETTMMYISANPKRIQANYMRYAPSYV